MTRAIFVNCLLLLILAASVSGNEPRKIVINVESRRVSVLAAADDSTMSEIPDNARILFMLSAKNISPLGLKQLARLRQVEFLRLDRSSHGDAALDALADHPTLRKLMMWSGTGVTAKGIKQLSTISSLRSLDFTGVPLNQTALESMPDQVESLTISRCSIGDMGLGALPFFPNLRQIKIKYDEKVSDIGMMAFIKRHPQLEQLSVDMASDSFLASLLKLQNLKSLWLGGKPITETGLLSIGRLQNLDSLTISSDLRDEMRAHVRRLPNPRLKDVAHRGMHIYLNRPRQSQSAGGPVKCTHAAPTCLRPRIVQAGLNL